MATLLERRQSQSCRLGYVLVIEGCDYVFTDITDIVGTAYLGDGREILPGLTVPAALSLGINPRTGLLKEASARFKLLETWDDKLASLFRAVYDDDKSYQLARRISPTDTTIATSLTLIDLSDTVNPRGKHIGTERIGSDGSRRDYYIHPGTKPAGFDHPWLQDSAVSHLPRLEMSDEIRVWPGRHVALHEFVYDEDDGDWATFTEQYNNSSMIWRGTMQGRGQIAGTLEYEVLCDGPASLTRRQLNRKRSTAAYEVIPKLAPAAQQTWIAIAPHKINVETPSSTDTSLFEGSLFDDANDLTSTSRDDLISELSALFGNVIDGTTTNFNGYGGAAGTDYASGGQGENSFFIDSSGQVGISYHPNSSDVGGRVSVCMHVDFWALLGYDPVAQSEVDASLSTYVYFRLFNPQENEPGIESQIPWAEKRDNGDEPDFLDYYVGRFSTYRENGEPDNNGNPAIYEPLIAGGTIPIKAGGKQEVLLGLDASYNEGQKCFPPGGTYGDAEDRPKIDSTYVNTMGWFLLEGTIARGDSQFADVKHEPFAQVARCSWYDPGNGTIDTDSTGLWPAIVIECLEDPRAFGVDFDKMTAPWLSGGTAPLTATPMGVFACQAWGDPGTHPDAAFRLIPRILLSSGTSGAWGTSAIPTYPSTGTNAATQTQTGDIVSNDAEIADLGLNLEADAVDLVSFRELAENTIGTENELGMVKHGYVGPVQAEELLGSMLQGRGWCFGYRREPGDKQPKWSGVDLYSLFPASEIPLIDGAYLQITESDLAGDVTNPASWLPKVQQSWGAPVDAFDISTRSAPRGGTVHESKAHAMDVGSHRRSGSAVLGIKDQGLANPEWTHPGSKWDWRPGFRNRWQQNIATFKAKPNRVVTITVSQSKGQWLYPGTAFLYTSSRINSLDGQSIGVSLAPARVLDTKIHLRGKLRGCYTVTFLLIATSSDSSFGNVWGGSARVSVGGWTDNGGGVYDLVCEADWLNSGHGGSDISGFVEPSWSAIGGSTFIRVYQSFDLETFPTANVVTANVADVNTGTDTLTLTATSGTIYEDTLKIITLGSYDEQDSESWVRNICSFHTDGTGSTHTSGVAGKKLG